MLLSFLNKKEFLSLIGHKKTDNEFCPVFNYNSMEPKLNFCHSKPFGHKNLFIIERKLLTIFGFPQYGIHGNCWSFNKNKIFFHFAVRSKKLEDFPGLYDNLFAGGQPKGISIKNNLKKEAFEEAGLKEIKNKNLTRGGTINYFHEYSSNIHSGIIFVYDLLLEGEKLINIDGEVEQFVSMEVFQIYKLLESKKLKPNCIIPIADFFLRNLNDLFPKKGILEIERLLKNGPKIKS